VVPQVGAAQSAPQLSHIQTDLCRASLTRVYEIEGVNEDIESFFSILKNAGAIPLAVGGDHSITLPILSWGTVPQGR
jgi:arginase family enzyme